MILSATFRPSMAAEVIPPAKPAPSPQGYKPLKLLSKVSVLSILTGLEVRDSTPAKIVSSLLNPFIFVPKFSLP